MILWLFSMGRSTIIISELILFSISILLLPDILNFKGFTLSNSISFTIRFPFTVSIILLWTYYVFCFSSILFWLFSSKRAYAIHRRSLWVSNINSMSSLVRVGMQLVWFIDCLGLSKFNSCTSVHYFSYILTTSSIAV